MTHGPMGKSRQRPLGYPGARLPPACMHGTMARQRCNTLQLVRSGKQARLSCHAWRAIHVCARLHTCMHAKPGNAFIRLHPRLHVRLSTLLTARMAAWPPGAKVSSRAAAAAAASQPQPARTDRQQVQQLQAALDNALSRCGAGSHEVSAAVGVAWVHMHPSWMACGVDVHLCGSAACGCTRYIQFCPRVLLQDPFTYVL